MQNQIQIFQNEEFGRVRVVEIDGAPWFVGKDVTEILGYGNGSRDINRHVDEEDRKMEVLPQYQNGTLVSKTIIINESGLYALILSSKLPGAKRFKRWVTSEVLPTIRKHGAYATADTLDEMLRSPEFTETLIRKLAEEREKNAALEELAVELAPKALYCDVILQCRGAVQVSIIAKDYGMSAVAFNRLLHKLGVQYKIGNTWLLYKQFADQGFTQSKTYITPGGCGLIHTCWTQKGRFFLYETLKACGILPLMEVMQCDLFS